MGRGAGAGWQSTGLAYTPRPGMRLRHLLSQVWGVPACTLSVWEVEGGGSEIQGYPSLQSKLNAALDSVEPCL